MIASAIRKESKMPELNNNLNISGMHQNYAPNMKKGEDKTPPTVDGAKDLPKEETSLDKDPKAIAGKSQISKSSTINFKSDMDIFMKNPQLAYNALNAGDLAYELMSAVDVDDAYEKSCCGALDAAYEKCKK